MKSWLHRATRLRKLDLFVVASYFYNTGLLNALGGDASVQTGCNDKPASYQNPGSNAGTASYSGGTRDNNPVNKHGGTGAGGYTGAGGGTGAASRAVVVVVLDVGLVPIYRVVVVAVLVYLDQDQMVLLE